MAISKKISPQAVAAARKRLAAIRRKAANRGPVVLRCPKCLHFVVGIISENGEFVHRTGERADLYCCWPKCKPYGHWVPLKKAVTGPAPSDGSTCCLKPRRRRLPLNKVIPGS